MINNENINTSAHYFCFIYFPEKKSEILKPFLSYMFIKDGDSNFHIPYLDFDRVVPIPDSVKDEHVQAWIEENWKVGSNSVDNSIKEDGILFLVEKSNPSYLVKKMSEITKNKLKLLYVSIDQQICGEYLAYPDKDGVHIIYKPFMIEAPPQVIDEIQDKLGINITLSENVKQMVDMGSN